MGHVTITTPLASFRDDLSSMCWD